MKSDETRISGAGLSKISKLSSFELPMGRSAYAFGVTCLITVHYAGIAAMLWIWGRPVWSPLEYLSPFLSHRAPSIGESWQVSILGAWTLPFLWAMVTWSLRRARQAGVPAIAVLFLCFPGVNYFLVLLLCLARPVAVAAKEEEGAGARREESSRWAGASEAVVAGGLAGGLIFIAAFFALSSPYGVAVFVGAPVAIGLITTLTYNRRPRHGAASAQLVSQIALLAGAGILLLFGIEGGLCLAMTMPLAMPLTAIGSWLGSSFARAERLQTAHLLVLILASPFLVAFESAAPGPPLRAITTRVEIDAPPERVWPQVVAFAELPPPHELAFRLGIAYPMRARIEGHGVGAIRFCEFSTGAFVEPITRWQEPHRLAFDVSAQPPTMHEWSPYRIHPRHLTESLRSERGEFRLTALPADRTLLEGTTWYRHDLMPQPYWNLWSDALIHAIHRRVLNHIAARSEEDAGG